MRILTFVDSCVGFVGWLLLVYEEDTVVVGLLPLMCTLVVVVDKEVVEGVKFEFDDDIVTIVVDNFV